MYKRVRGNSLQKNKNEENVKWNFFVENLVFKYIYLANLDWQ